jgi:hypothetical protein
MPKRWELELRRLNDLDAPIGKLRARAAEPPRGDERPSLPPTRQRVVAGVVAFGVFIAAGTFLVRAIGPAEKQSGTASDTSLPVLEVSMLSDGAIDDGSDDPPTKVDYSADYGDVHVEGFTSTTSPGANADYVSVDDLGVMFPAPVAGSPVSITSDGEDARVTIGRLSDWPDFERFGSVETLPEPGRYVLTFEAVYPDGIARTSHLVDIVARGTVQITSAEGGSDGGTDASVVVDGASTPGILREGSFHYSDVITGWPPERPPEEPTFIEVAAGASIVLGEGPTEQRLRLSPEPPPWDDGVGTRLQPGALDAMEPGRYLLTYDVAWKHGRVAWDAEGTLESARFAFPIEIADEASDDDATFGEPESTLEEPAGTDHASSSEPSVPDVLRVMCTADGARVLTPTVETSPDGVRVIATPGSGQHADGIDIRPLGWPVFGVSSGSSGIDGEFVRAIPEGDVIVGCYRDDVEYGRTTPYPRAGEATAHVLDTNDHFTPWIPSSCPLQQQVAFDGGDRVELSEARGAQVVRALIPAIRRNDEVLPASYGSARWEESFFSIFRDGSVIGSVWIDTDDDGTARVASGFACSGSGIESGFDTYPAWEVG